MPLIRASELDTSHVMTGGQRKIQVVYGRYDLSGCRRVDIDEHGNVVVSFYLGKAYTYLTGDAQVVRGDIVLTPLTVVSPAQSQDATVVRLRSAHKGPFKPIVKVTSRLADRIGSVPATEAEPGCTLR